LTGRDLLTTPIKAQRSALVNGIRDLTR